MAFSTPNKRGPRHLLRRQSGVAAESLMVRTGMWSYREPCSGILQISWPAEAGHALSSQSRPLQGRELTQGHNWGFILVSNMISRDTGNPGKCIT